MKKCLFLVAFYFAYNVQAQVGINTNNPTSTLDITAKTPIGTAANVEGLLIPRVDREKAQSMTSVPTSTLIYVNNIATGTAAGTTVDVTAIGFYFYDGTKWTALITPTNNNDWHLTGNTGTNPANNFIGTTDDQILIFKSNNVNSGFLNGSGSSVAFGNNSLPYTATPNLANSAFGNNALRANSAGNFNSAFGQSSLAANTTGSSNVGIGFQTLLNSTTATRNIAIGASALRDNISGPDNTAVGHQSLQGATGFSNAALGSGALRGLTSGNSNIGIGYQAGFDSNAGGLGTTITSGNGNIMLGNNTSVPNIAGNDQMNVGNIIFGTGINGTLTTPTGNVGIGTSAPSTRLHVVAATPNNNRYNIIDAPASTNQYGIVALRNTSPIATGNYSLIGFTNSGPTSGGANWALGSVRSGATATNGSEEDFYIANSTGGGLSERMRIKPDTGYVGIGTPTPTARVEIASQTANVSGLKFTNINSSTPPTANTSPLGIDATGNVVVQSSLTTSFRSFSIDANTATNSLVTVGNLQFMYPATACTSVDSYIQVRTTTGANNIGIIHGISRASQASTGLINSIPSTFTPTFANIGAGNPNPTPTLIPFNCVQDGSAQFTFFSYTDRTYYRISIHVADGDSLGFGALGYIFAELQR